MKTSKHIIDAIIAPESTYPQLTPVHLTILERHTDSLLNGDTSIEAILFANFVLSKEGKDLVQEVKNIKAFESSYENYKLTFPVCNIKNLAEPLSKHINSSFSGTLQFGDGKDDKKKADQA